MNIILKLGRQKLTYILAFVLCAQGIVTETHATYLPTHETLENFEDERKIDELLLLIQKRLVIMHEVARTKWNHKLPVEDKIREQQMLADLTDKAIHYGLDERFVSRFFQAQIEASKEIQTNDFIFWREGEVLKFDKTFSLKDELRIYIDQLNHEILDLLSQIYTKSYNVNSKYILVQPISKRSSDYIENDIWLLAITPLKINQ
ncbi:MAG: gamma subclass chorismate mutase AroQ [Parachlamydiaceae bacterium]|nr:gamma subclass chorismate mutase AroQ [Parachlamydiaceae bacterium]